MNVGVLALIIISAWAVLAIAVSVVFGEAADARDAEPRHPARAGGTATAATIPSRSRAVLVGHHKAS